MKFYDHPARRSNPYPDPGTEIRGFRYDSALVLLRLRDAVRMRDGEDADYLTGRPFRFAWHAGDENWQAITVPEGLITDLTSVPWILRWAVSRVGPWLEAAILHDYLYIAWQDVEGKEALPSDRRFADDMMLAAMKEAGVGWVRRRLIHLAVSTFGGATYAWPNAERYVDLCDPLIMAQIEDLPHAERSPDEA